MHPHSPENIHLPPELLRAENKFKRRRTLSIILVVILFAAFGIFLFYSSPLFGLLDAANISPQIGTGVIETTIMQTGGESQPTQTSWSVQLRLENQTFYIIEYQDFHPGEQVKVSYRVGRSGRYYIDWIQPITVEQKKR